ncbi:MAG: ABC transporter permease [Nitriliruptor sp.]|nr:MAG: ABC transporter permease [Nitriliruptor sp.]
MLRAATVILRKDLRLRLRDRSVLLFAFVIPLALTFVFSQLFPTQEDFVLTAGVVDLDGGDVAAGFTQGVVAALVDDGLVDATTFEDEAAARDALEAGDIAAAWILPAGFSADVSAGDGGEIRVLVNPDRALSAEVARGIADGYRAELDRISLVVATSATAAQGALSGSQLEEIAELAVAQTPAVSTTELIAPDQQLDPTSYLAAGMAVFFLFFTVTFGITGFLEERQQGTLQRLLAAPIGIGTVHLGKAMGAFVLGIVSMTVLAIASATMLDASWGDPVGVAVLIVAGVISALGVMAFVGSFARTAEQAGNLQSIVALVFGLAGGVFFPIGAGTLGQLALVSPHGWFLRGLGDLVGSDSWTAVLPATAALVAFGVVFAVPGALRMRRETA